MAELCDLFASTSNGGAIWPNQLTSAGRGKVCYNVESHINAGQISLHQRPLELGDVLSDLLPRSAQALKDFYFGNIVPKSSELKLQHGDSFSLTAAIAL